MNLLDPPTMVKIVDFLDVVESYKGEACLVTIGSGPRVFGAGFNTKFWKENPKNMPDTIKMLHPMLAKLMTVSVHSLACVNGYAIGGGCFIALGHDRITMTSNPEFKMYLPETKMGIPIPRGYIQLVKHATSG